MRKLLLYILIYSPIAIYSQSAIINGISFEEETKEENRFIEILKLKDKNALIIQIGYSSDPIRGLDSDCIVYLNNGQIKVFKISEPIDARLEPTIQRIKIKKSEYQLYWEFLKTSISKGKLKIDKTKLNHVDEVSSTLPLTISGGVTYHFRLFQNKKHTTYSCFTPKAFISMKSPGSEEKQRLVDVMKEFENLIKMTKSSKGFN